MRHPIWRRAHRVCPPQRPDSFERVHAELAEAYRRDRSLAELPSLVEMEMELELRREARGA